MYIGDMWDATNQILKAVKKLHKDFACVRLGKLRPLNNQVEKFALWRIFEDEINFGGLIIRLLQRKNTLVVDRHQYCNFLLECRDLPVVEKDLDGHQLSTGFFSSLIDGRKVARSEHVS